MHLYQHIFEELKRSIEEGEIGPGERLPSIRDLALRYACNKLTVQRSFELLSAAGLVENRVGSGSRVRYPDLAAEGAGDFAHSTLSEDFFPFEEAGTLLSGLLASERGRVFSAPEPRGDPGLLEALARRYGLPERSLIVTGGAQQGLDLARRLLMARGGVWAAVEDPGWPGSLALFRPRAALSLDAEGPDPGELDAFLAAAPAGSVGLFVTAPELHNPTGMRYSPGRKRALCEVIEARGAWVVEDDYLSELLPASGPGARGPRFVDLLPARTLWIKSLSKTTAPGIRIGALAAPPELVEDLLRLKAESDPGAATWLQGLARAIIDSGLHARHVARVAEIAARRRAALEALALRFDGLQPLPAAGGYELWVRAPASIRLADPPWAEGFRFGRSASTRAAFRLSFMSIPEPAWSGAMARLERAFEQTCGAAGR